MVRFRWVLGVEILQRHLLHIAEGMEKTLEEGCVLIPNDIVLVQPRLNLPKVKTRVWMEGEVYPILAVHPEIPDEEPLRSSREVEHAHHFVNLVNGGLSNRT